MSKTKGAHRVRWRFWGFRCSKDDCGRRWSKCEHFEPEDIQASAEADRVLGIFVVTTAVLISGACCGVALYYL